MSAWYRPLAVFIVFVVLAAACSGGSAVTTTTATATTIAPSTTSSTTTTTLAPVAPVAAGAGAVFAVTDYGAVADAKTDDAPAFQAAIDAAAEAGGGVVMIPAVSGRSAYVLATTVSVPTGVAVVGGAEGSTFDVSGPFPWPDVELTGVKVLARPDDPSQPLFQLEPGTTVRGMWITYDKQPLPTDARLMNEDGNFVYRSFTEAQPFFVDEHVEVTAPTFYIADGSGVTVSDVVADRYYDFLWMAGGGPLRVDGVSLHGYNAAFTVADSAASNTFTDIAIGPGVGPVVPGASDTGDRTWAFGAIVARPGSVGFQFGRSDGFVLDNVTIGGVNTAVRMGATFDYPIVDPMDDTFTTSLPGMGPWGQISNLRASHVVTGIHLVSPAVNAIQMSGVSIGADLVDGSGYPASGGTGELDGISRQSAVLVEESYGSATNGSPAQVPSVLATNMVVMASSATDLYGEASMPIDLSNGRIFLVSGDLGMEINGFAMSDPYDDAHMVASTSSADEVNIRIRGFLTSGRPEADKLVSETEVEVLTNDIIIIEQPPPPPPTQAPTTSEPPTTTGATTTTAAPTTTAAEEPVSTTESP